MKKFIVALALTVAILGGGATAKVYADPPANQPDNFGQCQQILVRVFGVNPSIGAPGQGFFGPAVIIYDEDHNVVAIHQASAFSFGAACNIVLDPSEPLQSAYVNEEDALVLVVREP